MMRLTIKIDFDTVATIHIEAISRDAAISLCAGVVAYAGRLAGYDCAVTWFAGDDFHQVRDGHKIKYRLAEILVNGKSLRADGIHRVYVQNEAAVKPESDADVPDHVAASWEAGLSGVSKNSAESGPLLPSGGEPGEDRNSQRGAPGPFPTPPRGSVPGPEEYPGEDYPSSGGG
jgi:hypothetical protein